MIGRVLRPVRRAADSGFVAVQRTRRRLAAASWRTLPQSWRRPFEVAEGFDVWDYLADLAEQVSALLADHGVEHLVLQTRILPTPVIVIRRSQADEVRGLLARDPRAQGWWLASVRGGIVGRGRPASSRLRTLPGSTGMVVTRNLVSTDGLGLVHTELGVLIDYWQEFDEPTAGRGGGEHPAGTLHGSAHNGFLDYVGPTLWQAVQANGHRLPAAPPHLLELQEPVDLVLTCRDAGATTLRYALRSVSQFANWVRHVWIVTDGMAPAWLRPDDRLTVVDAADGAVAMLPGLAAHHLELGDDQLFGAPVLPEDFFHGNGIRRLMSPSVIDLSVARAEVTLERHLRARAKKLLLVKAANAARPQLQGPLREFFETYYPLPSRWELRSQRQADFVTSSPARP